MYTCRGIHSCYRWTCWSIAQAVRIKSCRICCLCHLRRASPCLSHPAMTPCSPSRPSTPWPTMWSSISLSSGTRSPFTWGDTSQASCSHCPSSLTNPQWTCLSVSESSTCKVYFHFTPRMTFLSSTRRWGHSSLSSVFRLCYQRCHLNSTSLLISPKTVSICPISSSEWLTKTFLSLILASSRKLSI